MSVRLRVAGPLDAAALAEVDPATRVAPPGPGPLLPGVPVPGRARAGLVADLLHGLGGICLVVETGVPPAVVGYAALRHEHFFGRAFVELVVVAPEHRGRGLGAALLAAAVDAAPSPAGQQGVRVFTSTTVSNLAVRALLASRGWRLSGRLSGLRPGDEELVAWRDTTPGAQTETRAQPLLHLAVREDWERAVRAGEYRVSTLGAALDQVGFVHCSFPQQLAGVARAVYGRLDRPLVVLELDRGRLPRVRVEPVPGSDEVFPHVYGPIPVDAVREVLPVRRARDGSLLLPVG